MYSERAAHTLIVGSGPAGLATASAILECGQAATLAGTLFGGPLQRGVESMPMPRSPGNLSMFEGVVFNGSPEQGVLSGSQMPSWPENHIRGNRIRFKRLVLATGARELFLPFPGWTLPGVLGAGGLQLLVKKGLDVRGKRIAIAGSGPLLRAVAATMLQRGAAVVCLAEQAPAAKLAKFAATLARFPEKLVQGAGLAWRLLDVPQWSGAWPVEVVPAPGNGLLLRLTDGFSQWSVEADLVACGFGLVPETHLAQVLGCKVENGAVVVDERQRTSVENIWCCGEATGIGGEGKAQAEGHLAGLDVCGRADTTGRWTRRRRRARDFARLLADTFALRPELRTMARPDTFICRCEDVRTADVARCSDWREAKLHTRCGMGLCQGRVCGPAAAWLWGMNTTDARFPVSPTRIAEMLPRLPLVPHRGPNAAPNAASGESQ